MARAIVAVRAIHRPALTGDCGGRRVLGHELDSLALLVRPAHAPNGLAGGVGHVGDSAVRVLMHAVDAASLAVPETSDFQGEHRRGCGVLLVVAVVPTDGQAIAGRSVGRVTGN